MTEYYSIVTNIGAAQIANASVLGGKVDIVCFAVGDAGGAGYQPSTEMTALRHEVWRGNITSYEVDEDSPNLIRVRAVLPSNVGGFTIRELGVFDSGGNLIAVGNTPDTPKLTVAEGISSEMELTLELLVSNSEALQCTVDPTVIIATKADVQKLDAAKVDKIPGKGLSTHDYTDADKGKVDGLPEKVLGYEVVEGGPLPPAPLDADRLDGHEAGYFATAAEVAEKAPLASPAFVGAPTVNGVPLATATPPQEFDLPLATGISKNVTAAYLKTQDGLVHCYGSVVGSFAANVPTKFAFLPEGYLPKNVFAVPATTRNTDTGVIGAALIDVTPSAYGGYIDAVTGSDAKNIYFSFSFVSP